MSAVEVVAEALAAHWPRRVNGCGCGAAEWSTGHQAEAVLAALATASPQVQAEAIGGRHERFVSGTGFVFERAIGLWREVDQ
jgi:hypothetical protein